MADTAGTEAAGRVADVLLAFLDGPSSLGVSALGRRLGLSKAVVHRILQALVDRGLLEVDPLTREYRLGPAAAGLGARALRESDLRLAALPVLRELQRATGETTTVSRLVGSGRVYLDQVESTQEIKMTVELGRRFPLHAGSSSTCMLAFLPPDQQEEVLAGTLEALTPATIVAPDELRARIAAVLRDGFARSLGERQDGAGSLAAPVFGVDGSVIGSVSVCGPVARLGTATQERFAPLVVSAADRISRSLGWRGGLPSTEGRATA